MRKSMGRERRVWVAGACLLAAGCHSPDPKAVLEVKDVETHWAVDSASGNNRYISPVARFHLRSRSAEAEGYIQATATFRRKGEENLTWGSDFRQVSSRRDPLRPGQEMAVMLISDARYFSTAEPAAMFLHEQFKDATVEIFLRVGSSPWTSFGKVDVDRRIGARSVQDAAGPPAPGTGTPASP